MLPRPATMVTGVIVAFAIGGVLKLSTRNMSAEPRNDTFAARIDSDPYRDQAPTDDSDHSSENDSYEETIDSLGSALDGEIDLEPADEVEPELSTAQTSTIEALLQAADAIEALAEAGRSEFATEAPASDDDADLDKWNEFVREWDDDVTEVATRMPSPPSWAEGNEVTESYRDLASALQELREATLSQGSSAVPSRADWSARFAEVSRRLEQARSRLTEQD